MANYCHECGTATQGHSHVAATVTKSKVKVKKPRKPSKYNLAYAKNYAKMQKKHPRSKFPALAKKAHVATKKELK